LTADCVRKSSSAALVKERWRAAASKPTSRSRGGNAFLFLMQALRIFRLRRARQGCILRMHNARRAAMRIELKTGAVRLGPNQTLRLLDGAGSKVCALEGSVW